MERPVESRELPESIFLDQTRPVGCDQTLASVRSILTVISDRVSQRSSFVLTGASSMVHLRVWCTGVLLG
jgi:hypothetical protein